MNHSGQIIIHSPFVQNLALWFSFLSPLIGLVVGALGAWLAG
jgi:hypothetical protein